MVDGRSGPVSTGVGSFVFSPDSKRLAYLTGDGTGGGRLIVDGQGMAADVEVRARMVENTYAVKENPEYPKYDAYRPEMAFSPDSKRLAYISKTWVYVDGKEVARTQEASNLTWCPDSGRVAYIERSREAQATERVACGDYVGPWYHRVLYGTLQFSADGKHLGYVACASRSGPFFVVYDGKPQGEWAFIAPESLWIDADGKARYVAASRKRSSDAAAQPGRPAPPRSTSWWLEAGDWERVIDGKGSEWWGIPTQSARSPDRRQEVRGYVVRRPSPPGADVETHWIEADGAKYGPFVRIERLQFSPDGQHWGCLGWQGPGPSRPVLVVDGASLPLPFEMSQCGVLVFEAADRLRLVTQAPRVMEVELWLMGAR